MKKILSVLFTLITFISFGQQYNPAISTPVNKPIGSAQAIPTDARTYFWDATNFKYRPYQNTAEVLSYLYLPKYRAGNFEVIIHTGGTLVNGSYVGGSNEAWWFKNCTDDTCLVVKQSSGGGSSNLDSARTATQIQILNSNGNGTIFLSADTVRAGAYPAADKKKVNRIVPFSNYDELRTTSNVTSDTTVIYQDAKGNQFQYDPNDVRNDDTAMIIVNGGKRLIRVTEGTLYPWFFNAVGDGVTDDWWHLQKLSNYFASTAVFKSWSIKFGRNFSYYVTKSVEWPHALGIRSFIDIDGQGSYVITDKANVHIFRRMPADQDEAGGMVSDWRGIIHNFNFEGTGLTGQKGMEFGALYQWSFFNNYVRNTDTSYDFRFSLGGTYINLGSYGARRVAINAGYGTWSGGGHGTSAFNNNIFESMYVNCYDASFAAIALTAVDQANISNVIIEGLKPYNEYYFNADGSTLVQANTVRGLHSETIPGTLTSNTVFKIKGSGVINIIDCHTERTSLLFNLDSSLTNTHINIRNFAYFQTVDTPFSAKGALLDGLEISGQNKDLVVMMHNASKWANATVPNFPISYQGASNDYETRNNVTWNIYGPDMVIHTTSLENLGVFSQYNTTYFNDDINLVTGRFHVQNGNIYQHEYLTEILSQQIYNFDSSFLETWNVPRGIFIRKLDKFGHLLLNATDATQNPDSTVDINGSLSIYKTLRVKGLAVGSGSDSLVSVTPSGTFRKVPAPSGTGTVTSVSVVNANGFNGSVATATTTPAITISTTVTGIPKGNGTAFSAATSGTDYSAGTSALGTGILKSTTGTGALTIAVAGDFPTLNQSTTGNAATATALQTPRAINGTNFDGTAPITITAAPSGTAGGELAGTYPNPTLSNSAVIGKVLTGYTSGSGTVASTDNILQAIQKLNGNDGLRVLANGAITGATHTKITYDTKGLVTAGVDATTSDIAEGTNLYFTNARAAGAISLTTTGSGAATYNNTTGALNIPTPSGNNIYNADGTLTANRTVTMSAKTLNFTGGYIGISQAVPSQALHVHGQVQIDTMANGSTTDSVLVENGGLMKRVLQSSIAGTNIGNTDLTLSGNRNLTFGSNYFRQSFDGSNFINRTISSAGYAIDSAVGTGVGYRMSMSTGTTAPLAVFNQINGSATGNILDARLADVSKFTVTTGGAVTTAGTITSGGSLVSGGGILTTNATASFSNLYVTSGTSAVTNTQSQNLLSGWTGVTARRIFRGSGGPTLTVGDAYVSTMVGTETFTEAASGTHPLAASLLVRSIVGTNAAAATTTGATVYIEGAMTGVTPSGTNDALNVASGSTRLQGNLLLPVTVSSAGTLTLSTGGHYILSGTSATWTLPSVASSQVGLMYFIKNRASSNITINAAAAANEIYNTAAVNTITVAAGAAIILVCDGTYFLQE